MGNLYIFRKKFQKYKKIKNFSQENQKIKLPTNKLTETLKVTIKKIMGGNEVIHHHIFR